MDDAAFLLVGWTPDECEGKNLNGAKASDTSNVTRSMIEKYGKYLGPPEGYYQAKLGGPFQSLSRRNFFFSNWKFLNNFVFTVISAPDGIQSIDSYQQSEILSYLTRSGISAIRDAIIGYASVVCSTYPNPFAGRKRKVCFYLQILKPNN